MLNLKDLYHQSLIILIKNKQIMLVFCLLYLLLVLISFNIPLGFDDSYYLLVAKNLALKGFYGTNEAIFDPNIATGFPLIGTIALSFKLLTVGTLQVRIITIGYFIGLLASLFYLSKSNGLSTYKLAFSSIILYVIICLFSIKNYLYPVFNSFGEILSIFFFIISLIFIDKTYKHKTISYAILSGLFLGLSISTKYIMLVAAFSSFSASLIFLLTNKNKLKLFRLGATACLFMIIPELLFQTYHFLISGFNNFASELYNSMLHYKIIDQERYEFPQTGNNFYDHSYIFNLNHYVFFAPVVVFIFSSIVILYGFKKREYILLNLGIFVFTNYVWWFFISHNVLIMHLFLGTSILAYIFAFIILRIFQRILNKKVAKNKLYILLMLTILATFSQFSFSVFYSNLNFKSKSLYTKEQKNVADFVNKLSDSNLYYGKFDSAPEISFLTAKNFVHLYNKKNIEISTNLIDYKMANNYLITTSMRLRNDPVNYRNLIKTRCKQVVLKTYNYLICQL